MSGSPFLLLVISIISCTKDFIANPNSLRPWGENLAREEPYQDSYIATFKAKGKTLIYIAARHATNPNDLIFRIIERSMKEFSPDVIILEGFSPNTNFDKLRNEAKECAGNFVKCDESYSAIYHAPPKSKILSGEPDESEIVSKLEELGYSRLEILYFYLLRQVLQMKRQDELRYDNFETQANTFLQRWGKRLNVEFKNISYKAFLEWFTKHSGSNFSLQDIDSEKSAPVKGGTYFQTISYQIGIIRDTRIISVIADALNENSKVMIIYGSSHLPVQLKSLKNMLGRPTYTQ